MTVQQSAIGFIKSQCERKKSPSGALPFRLHREAWPIFLGQNILSGSIFLDLVFCLFKFIFLGSHLVENL